MALPSGTYIIENFGTGRRLMPNLGPPICGRRLETPWRNGKVWTKRCGTCVDDKDRDLQYAEITVSETSDGLHKLISHSVPDLVIGWTNELGETNIVWAQDKDNHKWEIKNVGTSTDGHGLYSIQTTSTSEALFVSTTIDIPEEMQHGPKDTQERRHRSSESDGALGQGSDKACRCSATEDPPTPPDPEPEPEPEPDPKFPGPCGTATTCLVCPKSESQIDLDHPRSQDKWVFIPVKPE